MDDYKNLFLKHLGDSKDVFEKANSFLHPKGDLTDHLQKSIAVFNVLNDGKNIKIAINIFYKILMDIFPEKEFLRENPVLIPVLLDRAKYIQDYIKDKNIDLENIPCIIHGLTRLNQNI